MIRSSRGLLLAGLVLALAVAPWAVGQEPPNVVGSFSLTGTRGSASSQVNLTVAAGADGSFSVTRSATYSDGPSDTWTGTGSLRGRSLWVQFPITAETPGIVGILNGENGNVEPTGFIRARYYFAHDGKIYGRLWNRSNIPGWTTARENGNQSSQPPAPAGRIQAQVTRIVVQDTVAIADARPPHFERSLGAQNPSRSEPAAIFQNRPLHLRVTLSGPENLSQAVHARLLGEAQGVQLAGEVDIDRLVAGEEVDVTSAAPLNARVAVNALSIRWSLDVNGQRQEAGPQTPLRVYTTYREPRRNISNGRSDPASRIHFEMACTWANGASQNIGEGDNSLAYQLDNQMRHFVHPTDYKRQPPAIPCYPLDSRPPANYADLPGAYETRESGERPVCELYYPPLEPRQDYENYSHYARNFGWWVLDNPTHTGGRCNQQASLVADVLGTVGIEARVHYLERYGVGRRTGRPVRNYFYAAGGGGPWNFHGLCLAVMEDGSQWLYDGSFSFPPRRKFGSQEWAEGEHGPFIERWADWYYEDGGGVVPANDIPTSWEGVPRR